MTHLLPSKQRTCYLSNPVVGLRYPSLGQPAVTSTALLQTWVKPTHCSMSSSSKRPSSQISNGSLVPILVQAVGGWLPSCTAYAHCSGYYVCFCSTHTYFVQAIRAIKCINVLYATIALLWLLTNGYCGYHGYHICLQHILVTLDCSRCVLHAGHYSQGILHQVSPLRSSRGVLVCCDTSKTAPDRSSLLSLIQMSFSIGPCSGTKQPVVNLLRVFSALYMAISKLCLGCRGLCTSQLVV